MSSTYTVRVSCTNCSVFLRPVEICKGTLIKDHPCPTCGCKALRKA